MFKTFVSLLSGHASYFGINICHICLNSCQHIFNSHGKNCVNVLRQVSLEEKSIRWMSGDRNLLNIPPPPSHLCGYVTFNICQISSQFGLQLRHADTTTSASQLQAQLQEIASVKSLQKITISLSRQSVWEQRGPRQYPDDVSPNANVEVELIHAFADEICLAPRDNCRAHLHAENILVYPQNTYCVTITHPEHVDAGAIHKVVSIKDDRREILRGHTCDIS